MKQSFEFSVNNLEVTKNDNNTTGCYNEESHPAEYKSEKSLRVENITVKVDMDATEQEYIKLMEYIMKMAQMFDAVVGAQFNITVEEPKAEEKQEEEKPAEDTSGQA